MKKVLYSLPVMIVLIVAFSLPVFADSLKFIFSQATGGVYVFDTTDGSTSFVDKNIGMFEYTGEDGYTSMIRILHGNEGKYSGFRIKLYSQGFVQVQSGYYFTFSLSIKDAIAQYASFNPRAYVVASDGSIYELNVSWSPEWPSSGSSGQEVLISVGGRVGDGSALHFGTLVLDFQGITSHSSGIGAYILYCDQTIRVTPTPDQLRHDQLIGEIQDVTNELKNEDFGYTTPDSELGVTNDLSDTNTFIGGIADGINDMYDQIGDGFESLFFENPAMDVLWCWFGIDRIFIYTIVFSSMTFLFIRKLVK